MFLYHEILWPQNVPPKCACRPWKKKQWKSEARIANCCSVRQYDAEMIWHKSDGRQVTTDWPSIWLLQRDGSCSSPNHFQAINFRNCRKPDTWPKLSLITAWSVDTYGWYAECFDSYVKRRDRHLLWLNESTITSHCRRQGAPSDAILIDFRLSLTKRLPADSCWRRGRCAMQWPAR